MTAATAPNRRLIAGFIGTAFFTFVVLLHVTFPNMGGSGLRLPFNAAVWMGVAVMMAIAMWPAARGVIRFSAFHKALGMLLLALWLPFAWSWNEASLIALPRMLTVTAGAILLLGLAQLQLTRRDWWWQGMAILAGALLETAFGYVQLYLLEPGNWLGYDPAPGRPYGIFQQVNVMASFLVTGLTISAWLIGEARSRLESGITLLAPLFMPALILVIQSRTGWLTALIAVPLVLVHLWHLDRGRFKAWGAALVAGCLLAGLVWWAPWAEASYAAKAVSAPGERLPVYLHSLKMIAQEPLTGWGYGRFQHDFLHSFADWRASLPVNQPEIVEPIITQNFSHPHNELLYWGIEGGLLPVLAILGFGGCVAWRLWAHGPRGERLLLTALLLPLALHAMTELPFYHSLAHWLVFLLLLGMVANVSWQTQEKENRYTFGIRVGVWLAAPVLWIFMGTHQQTLWQTKIFVESQGNTTGALTKIINPFGIPRDLDFLVMSQHMSSLVSMGMNNDLERFYEWVDKESRTLPGPQLYNRILEAQTANGGIEKEIAKKINHLFPNMIKFQSRAEFTTSKER